MPKALGLKKLKQKNSSSQKLYCTNQEIAFTIRQLVDAINQSIILNVMIISI